MQTAPVIQSKFDTVGSYLSRVSGPFQYTAYRLSLTGSGIPLSRIRRSHDPLIMKIPTSEKTHTQILNKPILNKPKFMGPPPHHPWWKTGSPEYFRGGGWGAGGGGGGGGWVVCGVSI